MRKSRWVSWFSNLADFLLIILAIILLLGGVFHFIYTFYLYEQAEARHFTMRTYWWFKRMTEVIWMLTLSLWIALSSYKALLRRKLETVKYAIRIKRVVAAFWWATIVALAFAILRIFIIFYHNPSNSVFSLIILALMVFFLVHTLVTLPVERRYYSKQPLCNIVAAGLFERHNKFLNEKDFDSAYDALFKACETAPEGTFLWCTLAFFCELVRNNPSESDKYMAKAKELVMTKKAESDSDKACYFNYLGTILYRRGDYEKGLEYMKQSIDIEPTSRRIEAYEKNLSEFKSRQQIE